MPDERSLEVRLRELQRRLDAVERAIPLASELVSLSERLNIPLNLYQSQLKQLVVLNGLSGKIPSVEKNDLSRAIIQALLEKQDVNISRLTREVCRLRGKASRRIIAGRLARLESLGIVVHSAGKNNEKLYRLNAPKE